MYKLQFFSRPSDEGDVPTQVELGYDGSMSVPVFHEEHIQDYLRTMDCIFGECLIIAHYEYFNPITKSMIATSKAYRTYRVHQD